MAEPRDSGTRILAAGDENVLRELAGAGKYNPDGKFLNVAILTLPTRYLADIPLEKPAGAREGGPSDALRKQARDLLDELPALELPAAVAYLRFLAQHMPSVDENGP